MCMIEFLFVFATIIFIVCAYVVKEKSVFILCQIFCNIVLIAEYIYLKSLSSALATILATIRFVVFYILLSKYKDVNFYVVLAFCFLSALFGLLTFNLYVDLIYVLAVIIYTACYKIKNLYFMKLSLVIPLLLMFIYSIIVRAYAGIISHSFEILVIIILVVYDKIKNKKLKRCN